MPSSLSKPVFFIGFMGAGKTSVVTALAEQDGLPAVDLDHSIEADEETTITQIFAKRGEEAFRDLETAQLAKLTTAAPALVSCGGGVVLRGENVILMKNAGYIVYLAVSTEEALERIGEDTTRPLLEDAASAAALLDERRPLYEAAADITIDTSGLGVGAVTSKVRDALFTANVLQ